MPGVDDLVQLIHDDDDLYRYHTLPIIQSLMVRHGRGKYDRETAVTLYLHLADNGARKYVAQYGPPGALWHEQFPKTLRRQVAIRLRDEFEAQAKTGGYDVHIPKKYRGVSGKTLGARADSVFTENVRAALIEVTMQSLAGLKMKEIAKRIRKATITVVDNADEYRDDPLALSALATILVATAEVLRRMTWWVHAKRVLAIGQDLEKLAQEEAESGRWKNTKFGK